MLSKKILTLSLLLGLSSSVFAAKICNTEVSLNDTFTGAKGWSKYETSKQGKEYYSFTKLDLKEKCQILTEKDTDYVSIFSKSFEIGPAAIPGQKLFGADFKLGSFFGHSPEGKDFHIEGFDHAAFSKNIKPLTKYARIITGQYIADEYSIRNDIMCMGYGKKCTSLITFTSNELDIPISPYGSNRSKSTSTMRSVVNEQSYSAKPIDKKIPNPYFNK